MQKHIDWEEQIQAIRVKATAAARHSERTVGGVSHMNSQLDGQTKALSEIGKSLKMIEGRLGSIEAAQRSSVAVQSDIRPRRGLHPPTPSKWVLLIVATVAVGCGVFFWS